MVMSVCVYEGQRQTERHKDLISCQYNKTLATLFVRWRHCGLLKKSEMKEWQTDVNASLIIVWFGAVVRCIMY